MGNRGSNPNTIRMTVRIGNGTRRINVKDFFKQDLTVGDFVAFNPPKYKGLTMGKVVGFTPQKVKVEYLDININQQTVTNQWSFNVVKYNLTILKTYTIGQ
jgi:hypothetical protein